MCGVIYGYALTGRAAEARSIADETLQTARAHGNPFYVAYALLGCGLVSLETDPGRSLEMLREGLGFARKHRMPVWEAVIGREAAAVEAVHGDFDRALDLFAACITSLHQAGDTLNLGGALLHVADCFVRIGWNDIASPLAATGDVIGTEAFDAAVRTGAAMTVTDAVHFALDHLARARGQKP